eukprot:NODE_363_length_8763_cov_0.834718.p11 type:complete len:102 gc:universal NODE_363_length_8763_cov_0.834718:1327-1022(-)
MIKHQKLIHNNPNISTLSFSPPISPPMTITHRPKLVPLAPNNMINIQMPPLKSPPLQMEIPTPSSTPNTRQDMPSIESILVHLKTNNRPMSAGLTSRMIVQ